MLVPMRCVTCNALLAHLWRHYQHAVEVERRPAKEVLDELLLTRYCCRAALLTNVDMVDTM
jgi:DNA-directed RNA polymerase subunit N (RpoN/RPB10)